MENYQTPTIRCVPLSPRSTYLQITSDVAGTEASGKTPDIIIQEG